jgi:hypothetical protein
MLHATRHDTGRGNYSEREVARQFGHTVQTLDRVYADIPKDMLGIAGLTMDEIIRNADCEIWGPMPGDLDYRETEYDLLKAQELTEVSRTALAARLQRGSIPGVKRRGKWYVTRFDLQWHGLLTPTGLTRLQEVALDVPRTASWNRGPAKPRPAHAGAWPAVAG